MFWSSARVAHHSQHEAWKVYANAEINPVAFHLTVLGPKPQLASGWHTLSIHRDLGPLADEVSVSEYLIQHTTEVKILRSLKSTQPHGDQPATAIQKRSRPVPCIAPADACAACLHRDDPVTRTRRCDGD
nr:hypothetical protein CFP56_19645 [Quercus suber]